ncbi:MAG: hypothetical protein OJF58_002126 [Enhydrobacter sp.]|jgi:hypothetical protein|nr:MAG: hypothetical protein OJF58_002126 [Enhydrobacter sp.]
MTAMRRRLIGPVLAGLWPWPFAIGTALAWPEQPIRLIVPYAPAGGSDMIAPNGAPTEIVARLDKRLVDILTPSPAELADRWTEIIARRGTKPE